MAPAAGLCWCIRLSSDFLPSRACGGPLSLIHKPRAWLRRPPQCVQDPFAGPDDRCHAKRIPLPGRASEALPASATDSNASTAWLRTSLRWQEPANAVSHSQGAPPAPPRTDAAEAADELTGFSPRIDRIFSSSTSKRYLRGYGLGFRAEILRVGLGFRV